MKPYLTRRRLLALGSATLATTGIQAPALASGAESLVTMKGRAFGSHWAVSLHFGAAVEKLRPAVEAMLAEVDRMMSPWQQESEITAFNVAPAGTFPVSSETALVTQAALETARASEGWFDPTVGPLVAQWGFGPIEAPAGEATRWDRLAAAPEELAKSENGLTLDLCGIAKGRALDLMADIIAGYGHQDFLIDLGGELMGQGFHPEGRHWQVAVEDPRTGFETPVSGLQLDGQAVATSGLRAQSYQIGHTMYSHIIDPHDGSPVQSPTLSVSVIARDGMTADAWATALVAAGSEGPALAERRGVSALFLMQHHSGLDRITTGDFNRFLL